MADGRWVMTKNELDNVACGFESRGLEKLPNHKLHRPVDNRKGDAEHRCAFCGNEALEAGFGGYGEGYGYLSELCPKCGGTTDFVYKDEINKFF